MGKITITTPDDLEQDIRNWLIGKYHGRIHGRLTEFVTEALEDYLRREIKA